MQFYLITYACLFALCGKVLCAEADNEDQIQIPSQQETLSFLKIKLPLAVKVLEQVKNNEGDEQHDEVMHDFRNKLSDYLAIKENEGLEAADLYLTGLSIDLRMDVLLHHYHEGTKTSKERKKLKTQIRSLLLDRLEHDKQAVKMQLKLIEKERKKLTEELQEMEKYGDEEIELEFRELLEVQGEG
ncbi:hypothetical protein OAM01_00540 [bacterium]|nr:hypothetical protein [bacterium]